MSPPSPLPSGDFTTGAGCYEAMQGLPEPRRSTVRWLLELIGDVCRRAGGQRRGGSGGGAAGKGGRASREGGRVKRPGEERRAADASLRLARYEITRDDPRVPEISFGPAPGTSPRTG